MKGFISPPKYVQGYDCILALGTFIKPLGSGALILIDEFMYDELSERLAIPLKEEGIIFQVVKFRGEVTTDEITRLSGMMRQEDLSVIVGIGGGKTADTAKAVSDGMECCCIIVPTTASTDAPCSSLSIVYDSTMAARVVKKCKKSPDLVLADSHIIMKAPARFLTAGMGDALATYPEARANAETRGHTFMGPLYEMTAMAFAISRACHEIVLLRGEKALSDCKAGVCSQDVEDVIEANILLSGLGFENTGCAGAHSVSKGISAVPECKDLMHGEKVAFGTLCQLTAEDRPEERRELISFYSRVGLPFTLEHLGIFENPEEKIKLIAEHSMQDSFWANEPFPVTVQDVERFIRETDAFGKTIIQKNMEV